ncbi:MAG: HAD family hydrolase [Candidatus Fermentibacteraceae bacterium]
MDRNRMVLMDYDGTLLREGGLDRRALRLLEEMGERDVVRVLATGRSPFSLLRSLEGRLLPVDYLILSTGVGVVAAPGWETVRSLSMGRRRLAEALEVLMELDVDYSVHHPFPENHRFRYRSSGSGPADDLVRRLALYRGFHSEMTAHGELPSEASQVVAIAAPHEGTDLLERVRDRLHPGMTVVRTTSPLDGESLWVELFPTGAGKGPAAAWLAELLRISPADALAVGNDYNDLDMLRWAGVRMVMEASPQRLLGLFDSADSAGSALERWLESW